MKLAPSSDKGESPVTSFVQLERYNAIRLVQHVHGTLAALSKVIKGTALLTADTQNLATSLMKQEVWNCVVIFGVCGCEENLCTSSHNHVFFTFTSQDSLLTDFSCKFEKCLLCYSFNTHTLLLSMTDGQVLTHQYSFCLVGS